MKVYFFLWMFILQNTYLRACPFASLFDLLLNPVRAKTNGILNILKAVPLCMTLPEIYAATKILCEKEANNTALWADVIQCHRPIDDDFLRKSGEAQCPIPRRIQDATDTDYSIEEVFFNICGLVEGNLIQLIQSVDCLNRGDSDRNVPKRSKEVADVRKKWGKNTPCEIGKCVKALDII